MVINLTDSRKGLFKLHSIFLFYIYFYDTTYPDLFLCEDSSGGTSCESQVLPSMYLWELPPPPSLFILFVLYIMPKEDMLLIEMIKE